jgi:hypothetical protein
MNEQAQSENFVQVRKLTLDEQVGEALLRDEAIKLERSKTWHAMGPAASRRAEAFRAVDVRRIELLDEWRVAVNLGDVTGTHRVRVVELFRGRGSQRAMRHRDAAYGAICAFCEHAGDLRPGAFARGLEAALLASAKALDAGDGPRILAP